MKCSSGRCPEVWGHTASKVASNTMLIHGGRTETGPSAETWMFAFGNLQHNNYTKCSIFSKVQSVDVVYTM